MERRKAWNTIDYTGLVNNHLTALYFVENKRHKQYWMFRCICGNEKVIDANRVKTGIIKSCGCWRDQFKPQSFIHRLYHIYKRGAEKRDYSFELDKELFNKLIISDCYYCKSSPNDLTYDYLIVGYKQEVNGIDRKDPKIGYTENNCVTCCKTCNYMKGKLNEQDFLEKCKQITEYER